MGLFGKLKDILFDEETIEIPIITKDNEEELKAEAKRKVKNKTKDNEEVIIHKIETPKKEDTNEDLFDMPKLKEEIKEEPKKNTFTFPVFEDEEKETLGKKRSDRSREASSYSERKNTRKASGYTNAYDYSYGKYKGDYKSSRLANQELLTKSLEIKEEHKTFTPSPIISPVWGVLNENYKKEDIVTKTDEPVKRTRTSLDLDSVRKKAYGTLEDEIELSLGAQEEDYIVPEKKDVLEEDGISINDLLIDGGEDVITGETIEQTPVIEESDEIFDILDNSIDDVQEEIDIDEDLIPPSSELDKETSLDEEGTVIEDIEEQSDDIIKPEVVAKEENEEEQTDDDSAQEDDLFDLIDSIYERKEEE